MSTSTKKIQTIVDFLENYINEEKDPDSNVIKLVTKDYIKTARKFLDNPNYGGESSDEEAELDGDLIAESLANIDTLKDDMKSKVELVNSYMMGRLLNLADMGIVALKLQDEEAKNQSKVDKTRELLANFHVAVKEDKAAMDSLK